MNRLELRKKLIQATDIFEHTKYGPIVKSAQSYERAGNWAALEEALGRLPSVDDMLAALMEKLQGKSVYTTIKRIREHKEEHGWTVLKGLTSLLTHVIIECEQGRTEYKLLIPTLLDRINAEAYRN